MLLLGDRVRMSFAKVCDSAMKRDCDKYTAILFWISEIKSTCYGYGSLLADCCEIIERQKKVVAAHKPSTSNLTVAFGAFALV